MGRTKYTFFGNIQMWFKACTQNTDLYESNCSISKAGSPNQDVPLWFPGGMGNWESWQVLWETRIWNSVVVVRREPGIWCWWEGDLGPGAGETGTWGLVVVRRRPGIWWWWWARNLGFVVVRRGPGISWWWEGDLGSDIDGTGTCRTVHCVSRVDKYESLRWLWWRTAMWRRMEVVGKWVVCPVSLFHLCRIVSKSFAH